MSEIQPRRSRGRSIGLTPLVDVVFILLLFFMLSSTFERWRAIDFRSPAVDVSARSDRLDPQILVLGESGSLKLRGDDLLVERYATLTARDVERLDAGRPLVLLSEPRASVQTIVSAIERLQGLGLEPILGGALPAEER